MAGKRESEPPQLGGLSALAAVATRVLSHFERYGAEARVEKVFGLDLGETTIRIRLYEPKPQEAGQPEAPKIDLAGLFRRLADALDRELAGPVAAPDPSGCEQTPSVQTGSAPS